MEFTWHYYEKAIYKVMLVGLCCVLLYLMVIV